MCLPLRQLLRGPDRFARIYVFGAAYILSSALLVLRVGAIFAWLGTSETRPLYASS